ncbi:MAG: N-formylglutamate amidohydrolase [Casimicrobiaceae bacterium]
MTATAAFALQLPQEDALPLLFDSPHSGRHYPDDWATPLSRAQLRRGEDAYVDELIAGAARHGISVLAAQFPRCYIDVNREVDDIDAELLAEPWPGPAPLRPTQKSRNGLGLIRRYVVPGMAIVDKPLAISDVRARIERVYLPYHRALAQQQQTLLKRFGFVWHVDWHSMKSRGNAMTPDGDGAQRPDMVVGDLDGTSADPRFVEWVVAELRGSGYRVSINDPYKGATIVRKYGAPARGCSTIQIEMNRALYLDESSVTLVAAAEKLKASLESLMAALAAQCRRHM